MEDLISRRAAIDELKACRGIYCDNTPESFSLLGHSDKSRVDEIDNAIAILVNLPSAQQWIPVTERLPEYGDKVLVTFRNKYIDRTTIGVSRCYVQKEGFFSDQPFDYAAVAWMPLPAPWEGGEA